MYIVSSLDPWVQIIEKAKNLVTYFRRSPLEILHEKQRLLKKKEKVLLTDVPTRWTSLFNMLSKLLECYDEIGLVIRGTEHANDLWTTGEQEQATKLIEILQYFNYCIVQLQSDTKVTLSSLPIIIDKLRNVILKADSSEPLWLQNVLFYYIL